MNEDTFALALSMLLLFAVLSSTPVAVLAEEQSLEDTCTHDWSEWWESEAPGCGTSGLEERYCALCYTTESRSIPATGQHDWSEWATTKRATVFRQGTKTRECLYCDKIQTKVIDKIKPFATFKKKTYSLKKGKKLLLKTQVKMGRGDSVKKWKVSNKKIATINKSGKLKALKNGTVKVTAYLKSGKKTTCTIKIKETKKKKKTSSGGTTVYWTPSGSVYHVSRDCPTLGRSKTVNSGTIQQSRKNRKCKVCG